MTTIPTYEGAFTQAGFELVTTGGGCMAWQLGDMYGDHVWVTDDSGCGVGEDDADCTWLIGRLDAEGEEVDGAEAATFEEAIKIAKGFWANIQADANANLSPSARDA